MTRDGSQRKFPCHENRPWSSTALILAGGMSKRMGTEKAFLRFGPSTLLEHVLSIVRPIFKEVLIVAKEEAPFQRYGVRVVTDLFPKADAMGGIATGLSRARGQFVFAFACDMPFLNKDLISYMVDQRTGYDLVIPRSRRGPEPLFAVYSKRCLPILKGRIERGERKLADLSGQVRTRIISGEEIHQFDPQERSFINVNTVSEYLQALEVT